MVGSPIIMVLMKVSPNLLPHNECHTTIPSPKPPPPFSPPPRWPSMKTFHINNMTQAGVILPPPPGHTRSIARLDITLQSLHCNYQYYSYKYVTQKMDVKPFCKMLFKEILSKSLFFPDIRQQKINFLHFIQSVWKDIQYTIHIYRHPSTIHPSTQFLRYFLVALFS